jgi:hypothetical protein
MLCFCSFYGQTTKNTQQTECLGFHDHAPSQYNGMAGGKSMSEEGICSFLDKRTPGFKGA